MLALKHTIGTKTMSSSIETFLAYPKLIRVKCNRFCHYSLYSTTYSPKKVREKITFPENMLFKIKELSTKNGPLPCFFTSLTEVKVVYTITVYCILSLYIAPFVLEGVRKSHVLCS